MQNKHSTFIYDHNVSFAGVPPKFKVEKKVPNPFYGIGCLSRTPIHSKSYFVNIDLWGKGVESRSVCFWAGVYFSNTGNQTNNTNNDTTTNNNNNDDNA